MYVALAYLPYFTVCSAREYLPNPSMPAAEFVTQHAQGQFLCRSAVTDRAYGVVVPRVPSVQLPATIGACAVP